MPRSGLRQTPADITPASSPKPSPAAKPRAKPRLVTAAPAAKTQPGPKPPAADKKVVQAPSRKSSAASDCNRSEPVPELLQVIVGRNLRTARLSAGLTLRQVAELSGILFQYVYKIENGEKNLTLSTIDNLAKVLNVSASDLLRNNPP
ncbi:MAG: helix-turn-helix domain-containing protein [Janthinobacterium lividum]